MHQNKQLQKEAPVTAWKSVSKEQANNLVMSVSHRFVIANTNELSSPELCVFHLCYLV